MEDKVIYKYSIPILDEFELDLPIGAEILTAQTQRNSSQLWALVDSQAKTEKRFFRLLGTGYYFKLDSKAKYINSFQLDDGDIVFHLFEVIK